MIHGIFSYEVGHPNTSRLLFWQNPPLRALWKVKNTSVVTEHWSNECMDTYLKFLNCTCGQIAIKSCHFIDVCCGEMRSTAGCGNRCLSVIPLFVTQSTIQGKLLRIVLHGKYRRFFLWAMLRDEVIDFRDIFQYVPCLEIYMSSWVCKFCYFTNWFNEWKEFFLKEQGQRSGNKDRNGLKQNFVRSVITFYKQNEEELFVKKKQFK